MGELLLAWVGRADSGEWERLAREYVGRLRRFVALEVVRLRPEPGRGHDPVRAKGEEGKRLLGLIRPQDRLVAVDGRGAEMTTEELAAALARWLTAGRVVLTVGSDLGLAPAVLARADHVLALSRFTLSHALARVLLLEQLYRALDFNAGGAYHRGGEGELRYNPLPGRHR